MKKDEIKEAIMGLNQRMEKGFQEINVALKGDDYGSKGYKQQLQDMHEDIDNINSYILKQKKKQWIERGMVAMLGIIWGVLTGREEIKEVINLSKDFFLK